MTTDSLAHKYAELLALRQEREALEADGVLRLDGAAGRERKLRCRELAQRFPGALRELEALDVAAMKQRLEWVQSGAKAAAFERFVLRYHELGRAMGKLKGWQGRYRRLHGARPTLEEARSALELGSLSDEELRTWLEPPGGYVSEQVWLKLAREFGRTAAACKAIVLSPKGEERI